MIEVKVFCVSNLQILKKISLLNINLSTNEWFDIISKKKIKILGNIILKPYQTYWLTNKVV